MAEIILRRDIYTPTDTTGRLYLGREDVAKGTKPDCYILEDTVRTGPKVYGKTAIPAGRYRITVTPSLKFGRILPAVCNVPGFEGIRIHPGNTSADTEGCLLPGMERKRENGAQVVMHSRDAFSLVSMWIDQQLKRNVQVWLTIINEPAETAVQSGH